MKMMNETLDNLFAHCQQLCDDDLSTLMTALIKEKEARDTRAEKEAWQRVMDAINNYINNFGFITVEDGDEGIELWRKGYTSSKPGSIEVGA
jgi:hypothetical protein